MPLDKTTFLDAFGANLYASGQYNALNQTADTALAKATLEQLFTFNGIAADVTRTPSSDPTVTVGLVFDRNVEASSLLEGNWAQRQAGLGAFASQADLWATYGADATTYNNAVASLAPAFGTAMQSASNTGYVSSAADRTIWLTLDMQGFADLFGLASDAVFYVTPQSNAPQQALIAWAGSLSLSNPALASVKGLWIDENISITTPNILNTTGVSLPAGPLGIGNGAYGTAGQMTASPAAIASHYNFPLGTDVPTDPIALIEGNISNYSGLLAGYNQYRQQLGLSAVGPQDLEVMSGAQADYDVISELTLDISVVAGAAPNSRQELYSYLSYGGTFGTPYNAYQQIFFDTTHRQSVLTSSYPVLGQPTAGSPFEWAWRELFKDGALANVSVHMAAGDEGASANIPNGVVNVANTHSSPFTLLVGGTSIAGVYTAQNDGTLDTLLSLALADDPATVFSLVAAGLKTLPSHLSTAAPAAVATTLGALFETVWQSISVTAGTPANVAFGSHQTGSGGVATGTPIPDYQRDAGLASLTGGARGMPDVAALASGDTYYAALSADYVNDNGSGALIHGVGGTSAAAPLWASLTTQFNAVFKDQGLPKLGYYNDLLYIAHVIAPGSFNDVQLGNNANTFLTSVQPTDYVSTDVGSTKVPVYVTPTGQGYDAGPGYDLASGLGTPNGLLLARALSAIAHSQVSFSTSPTLLDDNGQGGWQSGADQALLFQTVSPNVGSTVALDLGNDSSIFASSASANLAWTSRLAQQAMQSDFDSDLVLLFDRQSQGASSYAHVGNNQSLSLTIDGLNGHADQASLSNPFGFADFFAAGNMVRVARPLAIAETVGGANDQIAIMRMRQGGENTLQLTVYKVDDLAGRIDGLTPGHAAYAAAVQGRAYQTVNGDTATTGPGYGQYGEMKLKGIDAGDIIAMRLDNLTTGAFFWAFANANETVGGKSINHLWNYGLNTWGWEDTYGGGDQDYNDMIVQFDFTSHFGRGWLS